MDFVWLLAVAAFFFASGLLLKLFAHLQIPQRY